MTQQEIFEWIQHPERLNRETLCELRTLLARYPYFQTARLLYLKNLFLLHDPSFGEELRKAALYVSDRKVLFYLIEGERFSPASLEKKETPQEEGLDRTLSLIDSFLATLPDEPSVPLGIPLDVTTDYTSLLLRDEAPVGVEVPQLKGQELIDEFIGKQQELEMGAGLEMVPELPRKTAEEPILESERETMEEPVPMPESETVEEPMLELVRETVEELESGTESKPVWEPLSEENSSSNPEGEALPDAEPMQVSEESEEPEQLFNTAASSEPEASTAEVTDTAEESPEEADDESYFTETLAKIYVKQQRYSKALEIIKKLNLKYPKKNAYFADQIRFLEKLIINTKSK